MDPELELRRHKDKLDGWNAGRLGEYHDEKVMLETIVMILKEEEEES